MLEKVFAILDFFHGRDNGAIAAPLPLSDPEAADVQTQLSNVLRAFGFLEVKEFVVGVEGNTIFFIRDRAVR